MTTAEQPLISVFMNDKLIGYWRASKPDSRTRIDVPDFKCFTPMKITIPEIKDDALQSTNG